MKRHTELRRTAMRRSRKKIRARNPKRRAAEFARCYHSDERVAWVRALACLWCGQTPSENAHTRNGGKGRKAGYETIVPLTHDCHALYDQHRAPFDTPAVRAAIRNAAAEVEAAWQRHQHGEQHQPPAPPERS